MMTNKEIKGLIEKLAESNRRYTKEAYLLVLVGLEHTISELPERRHLTGQELSKGIADFARHQYGFMAKAVLEEWGVYATDDFGEIVYILIEQGLLTKTDTDDKADFSAVFSFSDEFSWEQTEKDVSTDTQ